VGIQGLQRGPSRRLSWALVCALVMVTGACNVRAVIFKFFTNDPGYNTNAPSGSLTNSGWQYEGTWDTSQGHFLATPIAPRYFIAAKHVVGTTNDVFVFNGYTYHPLQFNDCPGADLRVWQVVETFPMYASLYTNANEVGKHCVVFGRGTERGDPVVVAGKTNGWKWGSATHIERWGENDVVTNLSYGGGIGQLLVCDFDRSANSNECHLSVGDSSGGMFIQDGTTWKLAGIHYSVDGPFSNAVDGTMFNAALLDYGGLYVITNISGTVTNWAFVPNQSADYPTSFYSTRISTNVAWINSVIDFLPGDDLQITAIEAVGDDISISFASGSNRLYHVDSNDDLVSGTWTTFTNNVPGTGGIVSVLDTNAATLPERYYRLGLIQ
jgi:hypothetical protein